MEDLIMIIWILCYPLVCIVYRVLSFRFVYPVINYKPSKDDFMFSLIVELIIWIGVWIYL